MTILCPYAQLSCYHRDHSDRGEGGPLIDLHEPAPEGGAPGESAVIGASLTYATGRLTPVVSALLAAAVRSGVMVATRFGLWRTDSRKARAARRPARRRSSAWVSATTRLGGDDSRPAPDLPVQLAGQGVVIPVRGIGKGVPRAGTRRGRAGGIEGAFRSPPFLFLPSRISLPRPTLIFFSSRVSPVLAEREDNTASFRT